MRVVHVYYHHWPRLGYESTYLSRFQVQHGHEITILASPDSVPEEVPGRAHSPSTPDSMEPIQGEPKVIWLRPLRIRNRFFYLNGLCTALWRLRPELVHCHDVFSGMTIACALCSRLRGFKLVLCSHVADFNTNATGFWHRIFHSLFRSVAGRLIRRSAGAMTAIGECERLFLSRELAVPEQTVQIIRLPIDTGLFATARSRRPATRAALGFKDHELVVVHAGQPAERKNVHCLVQALPEVLKHRPHTRLLLIGGGERDYLAQLRRLIRDYDVEDQVFLVDRFLGKQVLADYLAASDIAAWPGDISITALEAMAAGLPLLAARTPYTEFLVSRDNGILVKPGHLGEVASGILRMAADTSTRTRMGLASRELVAADFDMHVVGAAVEEVYARLAG